MSERSNLSIDDLCETIQQSTLLLSESLSLVIEALSMQAENLYCATLSGPYVAYGQEPFLELVQKLQETIKQSKENRKISIKKTTKEKGFQTFQKEIILNNIYKEKPKKKKIKTKVLTSSTENSEDVFSAAADLVEDQKKIRTKLPKEYLDFYDRDEVPEKFEEYARRRKILCDLVPVFTDFVLYHSKKNSKFANWYAAWQTWVRNQITFHPECKNPINLKAGRSLTPDDMGRILEN